MTNQGELLTMKDCGEVLGMSVSVLRDLDRQGIFALGGIYGRRKRYMRRDVKAWAESFGAARTAAELEEFRAIERKRVGQ